MVPNNWYAIARVKNYVRGAQKYGGQPGRVSVRVRTGPGLKLLVSFTRTFGGVWIGKASGTVMPWGLDLKYRMLVRRHLYILDIYLKGM